MTGSLLFCSSVLFQDLFIIVIYFSESPSFAGTACSRLVDGAVPDRNLPVSASIPLISEALGNQRRERKQRALKRKQDKSCDQASESKLNADSSGSSLEGRFICCYDVDIVIMWICLLSISCG